MLRLYFTVSLFFFAFLIQASFVHAQNLSRYPIVPLPATLLPGSGEFFVNAKTTIKLNQDLSLVKSTTDFFIGMVAYSAGFKLKYCKKPGRNSILFERDTTILDAEGYKLTVTTRGITIKYKTATGAFYAVQTLRQLMPASIEVKTRGVKSFAVPVVHIEDAPRFAYRGFMLDVARHFQPIHFLKRYIDLLAFYKINNFHLHLTDDQGWRVEIKKYPKLQEISAWRKETRVGHRRDEPVIFDGKKHGGFYTQEELKGLVKYASERFITIIPEIDMPGHSQAVLAAYPQLGCKDSSYKVSNNWGVHKDIYCPTETSFHFLEDVLDEVMDIFPGKYIHIGGDEVPKDRWKESDYAQSLIKKYNLEDEEGLQGYFMKRIEKYLNAKGRSAIGWDDILEGGVLPGTTVMSWHMAKEGVAAGKGNYEIMAANAYLYFDYYQTEKGRLREPLAMGNYLPLEKVYSYNPIPKNLDATNEKFVLGVQANLWTEYITTPKHAEHMTFPRISAMAEVGWTAQGRKDYNGFLKRLNGNLKHLEKLDVNFANYYRDVIVDAGTK